MQRDCFEISWETDEELQKALERTLSISSQRAKELGGLITRSDLFKTRIRAKDVTPSPPPGCFGLLIPKTRFFLNCEIGEIESALIASDLMGFLVAAANMDFSPQTLLPVVYEVKKRFLSLEEDEYILLSYLSLLMSKKTRLVRHSDAVQLVSQYRSEQGSSLTSNRVMCLFGDEQSLQDCLDRLIDKGCIQYVSKGVIRVSR